MPTNTSRLGLANPIGADSPAEIRLDVTANNAILDNAAIYREGTLGSRPVAGSTNHGYVWRTTDAGKETLSWSDGSLWLPLGLIPASTAVSTGAASGQAVITTGSSAVTITAPSNTAGAMFSVVNQTTSVTTVSGVNIQGLGLSSASSFPLGSVGANAVLLGDGTNWQIIGGQQDSGWVPIVPHTGWIAYASDYPPAARLQGDIGMLRGGILNNTGGSLTNWVIGVVPVPVRPAQRQFFGVQIPNTNSGVPIEMVLSGTNGGTPGEMNLVGVVNNQYFVILDGLVYPVI